MPLSLLDGGVRAMVAAVAVLGPFLLREALWTSVPLPPPHHSLPPRSDEAEALAVISVCAALLAVMGGWMWTVGLGGMVGGGLRLEMVGGTERRRHAAAGAASVPQKVMDTIPIVVSSVNVIAPASPPDVRPSLDAQGPTPDAEAPPVDAIGYVEFVAAVDGQLELHLGVPGADLDQEHVLAGATRTAVGAASDGSTGDTGDTPGPGEGAAAGDGAARVKAAWFRSAACTWLRFEKGRNRISLTELASNAAAGTGTGGATATSSAWAPKPGKRRAEAEWPAVLLFSPEAAEAGCCSLAVLCQRVPGSATPATRGSAETGALATGAPTSTPGASATLTLRVARSLAVTNAGDLLELREVFEPGRSASAAGTGATCTICLEAICTTVLMPCRHRCVCHACLPKMERSCPICRGRIEYVLDVDSPTERRWL